MDVIRHFTHLSRLNYSLDEGLYPLGSCTMKYNPRINEETARLPGFAWAHPLQPIETVQGCLALMYQLQEWLKEQGFEATDLMNYEVTTQVSAPITGRIGRSVVTTGALVSAGQAEPLTTIQRPSASRLLSAGRARMQGWRCDRRSQVECPMALTIPSASLSATHRIR